MFSRSGKCPPAYFLCDNAKYLMGINIEGTNSDIKDRFEDSRKKHFRDFKGCRKVYLQRLSANILKNGIQKKQKTNPKVQERWEELNDGGNIILECEIIMHKMMKK